MRKILWLAKREYKATVRTKGFIIGLIIAPLLMSGGGIAFALLKDRVDIHDKKIAVIDHSGKMYDMLVGAAAERNANSLYNEKGKKVRPAYVFEKIEADTSNPFTQKLVLSDKIRRGELHALLEIGSDIVYPGENPENAAVRYYAQNSAIDDIRGWVVYPINNHLRKLRLKAAGVDEARVDSMLQWTTVDGLGLVTVNQGTGEIKDARRSSKAELILVPVAVMMLMYLIIMMTAVPLLSSVMEEKSQRIAEVLLGSVRPFEFMAGKVLGAIGISFTATAVYLAGGIITVRYLGLNEYIPYDVLPWFFAYMVLAILMYGSIFAALGSSCNNAKDAQSLTFPALMPLIISWFIFMPVLQEPNADLGTWVSLFPLCTPVIMLVRLGTPVEIPAWQPWVGLLGMIIFTLIAIWAGGRIFRVAILSQGTPPKLSQILKWAIRG